MLTEIGKYCGHIYNPLHSLCSAQKKIVSLNTLAKKNDVSFYLKKLEKEQQIKPEENKRKQ